MPEPALSNAIFKQNYTKMFLALKWPIAAVLA